ASCHWSCLRPFLRAPTVAPTQLSGRRHAPAPVAGSPPAANVPSVFARPRSRAADHAPVPWAWVRRPRARHAALDSRPGNNAAPIRPRPWPHRSASALRPAPRESPLPDAWLHGCCRCPVPRLRAHARAAGSSPPAPPESVRRGRSCWPPFRTRQHRLELLEVLIQSRCARGQRLGGSLLLAEARDLRSRANRHRQFVARRPGRRRRHQVDLLTLSLGRREKHPPPFPLPAGTPAPPLSRPRRPCPW